MEKKLTMELNGFDNYTVYVIIPQNTKNGEPELNKSGKKFQENSDFMIPNALSDVIWNQILDMIEETEPQIIVKLDDVTWMNCEPQLSLEEINTTSSFQHVIGGFEWYTVDNTKFSIKCVKIFPQPWNVYPDY